MLCQSWKNCSLEVFLYSVSSASRRHIKAVPREGNAVLSRLSTIWDKEPAQNIQQQGMRDH
jgi:hypothetical protein